MTGTILCIWTLFISFLWYYIGKYNGIEAEKERVEKEKQIIENYKKENKI